jgi:cephalosporin-C deacetylase
MIRISRAVWMTATVGFAMSGAMLVAGGWRQQNGAVTVGANGVAARPEQRQRPPLTVGPDRSDGVYEVGDTVHWKVEWGGDGAPPAAQYTLRSGGLKEVGRGNLDFQNGVATFDTKFDAPGTMLAEVTWQPDSRANRATAGAVAAPDRITPSAPPPRDFDAFWSAKIKELAKVPFNPQLEPAPVDKPGVSYWKVTLDNIRGAHIHGQLARPTAEGRYPAMLIVQWAGVYPLQRGWVTDRAAEGWLALNIEAHDIPIDAPASYYAQQSAGPLNNYFAIGSDDREKSYFLRMYLSAYQALEYLKTRPEWDHKTLIVRGTSQGGQQTLMLAGLHPKDLTAALALVPAGCDMLAPEQGRAAGYPYWLNDTQGGKDPQKVRETSRYFDNVNFARHIRCPVLVGLGLRDETCPPAGVLAALHEAHAPKELVILPKSGHQDENGSQQPYYAREFGVWLPALRQGRPAPVNAGR